MPARAPATYRLQRLVVLLLLLLTAPLGACRGQSAQQQASVARTDDASVGAPISDTAFAGLIQRFSEQGGYFDTDNLISNETSYLHVLGALRARGVTGGAYLGVGPDQNFSYIAQIRPEIAFIVDIRRDNLLQHLFFKALFDLAPDRLTYLCRLIGRPVPEAMPDATGYSIEQLVAFVDSLAPGSEAASVARRSVADHVRATGVPLTARDLATIEHIHDSFIEDGLDLRFTSHNQPPRSYYPTLRRLLLERDLTGRQGNYLAREEDFQYLKALQAANRVIPVVGDLAGPKALRAIGEYLEEQDVVVSAFYMSNVEFYLMRDGSFGDYAANVAALPHGARSVLIRSYFNRYSASHPQTVPGYASTQLMQDLERFVEEYERGGYRSYYDLIHKHLIDVR